MTRNRSKPNKRPVPEDIKLARALLPAGQARAGVFDVVDVSHFSQDDQRTTLRSGERTTLRRKPKLDTVAMLKLLDKRERAACEWYAQAHALRYDTLGITARWGQHSSSGATNFDHLPKTREQEDALLNFEYARAGIDVSVLGLFESVVLHGRPLGGRSLAFKVAVEQLLCRIAGRVNF